PDKLTLLAARLSLIFLSIDLRTHMNDSRETTLSRGYAATGEVMRNRVLRNTYWLLALSLIPTVLGAFVGLNTGLNAVMATSPGISIVVFLVGAFGLMYLVERNKHNSLGVAFLLAFTF